VPATSSGRPQLEVADILRAYGDVYARDHHVSVPQAAVLRHLVDCRTAALGGHVDRCASCDQVRISYNSCRDRHCPKCQSLKKAEWLQARRERLLPVPYWHVVFTLPEALRPIGVRNKRVLYKLLFDAAASTLITLARDPRHLGADIGFTAILHTWTQDLKFHPHLHCVVTGGGLRRDGHRWIPARDHFFIPVRVLGRLFRGRFLAALAEARRQGKLEGGAACLTRPSAWKRILDRLYATDWIVYAKPPFGGPEHVFSYLGRYTHRVAISNQRLVAVDDNGVTFTVKDRDDGSTKKPVTIGHGEFIRRFLLHLLPRGFTRIRHYGLLATGNAHRRLDRARELLTPKRDAPASTDATPARSEVWWQRLFRLTGIDVMRCPSCGSGRFVREAVALSARPPP
jgi:hypothetical protein